MGLRLALMMTAMTMLMKIVTKRCDQLRKRVQRRSDSMTVLRKLLKKRKNAENEIAV